MILKIRKEKQVNVLLSWVMLGIETEQYKFFSPFKIKVLERARDELLKKTDIKFNWKPKKTGRKVTGIHFKIKKNKPDKKEKPKEINKIQELINLVPEKHRFGIKEQ